MASSLSSETSTELPQSRSPSSQPSREDELARLTFAASLEAKDKTRCTEILDEHFGSLTQPGSHFEWLKDPVAIGLTSTEIVDLLVEGAEQSPWIHYDSKSRPGDESGVHPGLPWLSPTNTGREVAELCGLAGIIPTSSDPTVWRSNVVVDSNSNAPRLPTDC
jgi:hypothetical protein